jgi:serine/threonine protein kinase
MKELSAGDRISEYVLEERLGKGGFGEVWKARHHVLSDKYVAIKIPLDRDYVKQLKSEGIFQHELESDGVVKTLGLDPDHDPPYFVMEYVDGRSLRDLLKEKGRLEPERAVEIARTVFQVLKAAHDKKIVHRDIKPENVLIDREGRVKLSDFGLGQVVEATASCLMLSGSLVTTDGRSVSGTLHYMSPEQKDPEKPVDGRSDIYSAGLLLFEMLTGSLPEGGEVPSDLVPGLPGSLDSIFRTCYARLDRRYRSASEVLEDLENWDVSEEDEEGREGAEVVTLAALSREEVLAALGIDGDTLDTFVAEGLLHPVTKEGRALFEKREVDAIRTMTQKTTDEGEPIETKLERWIAPEEPRPPLKPAGLLGRTLALCIDCLVIMLLGLVLSFFARPTALYRTFFPLQQAFGRLMGPLLLLKAPLPPFAALFFTGVFSPLGVAYYVISVGLWNTTLGKYILGFRIVTADGGEPGFLRAFYRYLGYFVTVATLGVGFFMIPFHSERRALHDLLAGTRVIKL